jgi:hypothetical protein
MAASIPLEARVAASSNLYPHVAHRQWVHVFPHKTHPIDTVFVDLTEPFWPLGTVQSRQALLDLVAGGGWDAAAAKDGFLLLRRGGETAATVGIQDALAAQVRAATMPTTPLKPLAAHFGDDLELVGYRVDYGYAVNAIQLPIRVTTAWRALRPIRQDYGLHLRFTRSDGALIGGFDEGWPGLVWRPTSSWMPGETVELVSPWIPAGRAHAVLLAVALPGTDSDRLDVRLPIAEDNRLDVRQDGTLLRLADLPD